MADGLSSRELAERREKAWEIWTLETMLGEQACLRLKNSEGSRVSATALCYIAAGFPSAIQERSREKLYLKLVEALKHSGQPDCERLIFGEGDHVENKPPRDWCYSMNTTPKLL